MGGIFSGDLGFPMSILMWFSWFSFTFFFFHLKISILAKTAEGRLFQCLEINFVLKTFLMSNFLLDNILAAVTMKRCSQGRKQCICFLLVWLSLGRIHFLLFLLPMTPMSAQSKWFSSKSGLPLFYKKLSSDCIVNCKLRLYEIKSIRKSLWLWTPVYSFYNHSSPPLITSKIWKQ